MAAIISASRRTDIPAYYAEWFAHRLSCGEVVTRNPYNKNQQKRVSLLPEDVDGFVFWTKNPEPMLDKLSLLDPYAYYFNCTLTPYGKEIEPGVPPAAEVAQAMERLAERAGPYSVVWRYDPILLTREMTPEWHAREFAGLADMLAGRVRDCVISFYDEYASVAAQMQKLGVGRPDSRLILETATLLAQEAAKRGIRLYACCEPEILAVPGVRPGRCVDAGRLSLSRGRLLPSQKDKNQRQGCGCDASVDIGAYGTCPAGCRYCYAAGLAHKPAEFYRNFSMKSEMMG